MTGCRHIETGFGKDILPHVLMTPPMARLFYHHIALKSSGPWVGVISVDQPAPIIKNPVN